MAISATLCHYHMSAKIPSYSCTTVGRKMHSDIASLSLNPLDVSLSNMGKHLDKSKIRALKFSKSRNSSATKMFEFERTVYFVKQLCLLDPVTVSHLKLLVNLIKKWRGNKAFSQILKDKWDSKEASMTTVSGWSQAFMAQVILVCLFLAVPYAFAAADPVSTYMCLFKECRMELARCISNPQCAAYVGCIESCNNSPKETACQMKCGDLFDNSVVQGLNECAVSRKKCVPKKLDDGLFPKLQSSATVENFDIADFKGTWYISSGLNPLFDIFDCQVHEFYPHKDKLMGKWKWRVSTPDGGFFTRSTVQTFVQDKYQPGLLHYHDLGYLHNQDDWYIISSQIENKEGDYVFVYYRGSNDAWDGYGGALVYTRSPAIPASIVPRLQQAAASKIGIDFEHNFQSTDNKCGPPPSVMMRIQRKLKQGQQFMATTLQHLAHLIPAAHFMHFLYLSIAHTSHI